MSPVPDDFEQLRRLLALKRYEQPPPGYFHGFSREVIVRIKAGEVGESEGSGWSFDVGSLFQRIWAILDARPVLAGAFGVAVCGFFVVGALLSDTGAADASLATKDPVIVAHIPPAPWPTSETETPSLQPTYQPVPGSLFSEIQQRQQQQNQRVSVNFLIPSGQSN